LTITGSSPISNYQTLLNSVQYDNLSATPSSTSRIIEFVANDGLDSGLVARTTVDVVAANGVLISTDSVPPPTGTATLSGWEDEDIVELSDPGLMLQPAGDTAGTISLFQDMTPFTGKNITAMHFVGRDMTIGGGSDSVQLQYGDILFALKNQDSFNGNTAWSADLVRFRPSDSSFEAVAENLTGDWKVISAITLIEQDTTLGDTLLKAGSFLYSRSSVGSDKNDVWWFEPTALGSAVSAAGTRSLLIEGDDIGIDSPIQALHLVQTPSTLGGVALQNGWLMASVEDPDAAIGDTGPAISVNPQDAFYLDFTTTTLNGGDANATAIVLIDGYNSGADPNIEFDTTAEAITALSLNVTESSAVDATAPNNPPSVSLANVVTTLPEDSDTTAPIKIADIMIADTRDFPQEVIYFAQRGTIVRGEEGAFLSVEDGVIQNRSQSESGRVNTAYLYFDSYSIDLSFADRSTNPGYFKPSEQSTAYLLNPDPDDPILLSQRGRFMSARKTQRAKSGWRVR